MQKEITVKEIENAINSIDGVETPIIIKRNDKKLVVIGLEQYQ